MPGNTIISPISYQVLTNILLTLLFVSTLHTATAATTSSSQTYRTYVKTACNSTSYPQFCYNSLFPYASEIERSSRKLCKTALSVTIKAANKASSEVPKLLKLRKLTRFEAALIKDCVTNIKDSIDELKQSLHAMGHLSGSDKEFQMSNIKTWVSAALTDENTCMDGFDEGQKVSATVKKKNRNSILKIAILTSNALSLIDNLKY